MVLPMQPEWGSDLLLLRQGRAGGPGGGEPGAGSLPGRACACGLGCGAARASGSGRATWPAELASLRLTPDRRLLPPPPPQREEPG